MPAISPAETLEDLQRMAAKLEFRLYATALPGEVSQTWAPFEEAAHADEVDQHCIEVARALARPALLDLPSLTPMAAYFVLRRVQDAQRYIRESRGRPRRAGSDKALWYQTLLVDEWHTYAEPYWLERLGRHKGKLEGQGAAGLLA